MHSFPERQATSLRTHRVPWAMALPCTAPHGTAAAPWWACCLPRGPTQTRRTRCVTVPVTCCQQACTSAGRAMKASQLNGEPPRRAADAPKRLSTAVILVTACRAFKYSSCGSYSRSALGAVREDMCPAVALPAMQTGCCTDMHMGYWVTKLQCPRIWYPCGVFQYPALCAVRPIPACSS